MDVRPAASGDREDHDWSGHSGVATARRYVRFAGHVRRASPSYERLCVGVAGDPELLARLDTLPAPKRQPNLLLGAVRFLGGPVDAYEPFRAFVLDGWDTMAATMSARRTQTNEARRCATLLPVLAALPQPLALLEVGASAGLCLQPDRYAYRYRSDGSETVVGSSALVLDCATTGPVPLPDTVPEVAWRAGLDLNPLDVADDEDVRWLEALVWPEETSRFGVLREAVAIARRDPSRIVVGDLTTDVAPLAAEALADATLVVYHSAVLAYLDNAGCAAFRAQLDGIAASRPLVWLANEAPGVVVDGAVTEGAVGDGVDGAGRPGADDFVLARDGVALAHAHSHGGTLHWIAPGAT